MKRQIPANAVRARMARTAVAVAHWLWPPLCVICAEAGAGVFCVGCAAALPSHTQACRRCAAALPAAATTRECGECQQSPPAFVRAHALFPYRSPVSDLIVELKYAGRLHIARRLGAHLAATLAVDTPPDLILPVPLHPARLRARGFNQSLEIARPLAARLRVPLLVRGVARTRETRAQADLPRTARAKNVRNAFAVTADLTGLRVAIVDDVMTTGETVRALARAIEKAGAAHIEVWVLARA